MAASTDAAAPSGSRQRHALPMASASLSALPDELTLRVLAGLTLAERHRSAALVCKRWGSLALAPSLLRVLELRVPGEGALMLQRVRSLSRWLRKHAAGRVERLHVTSDFGDFVFGETYMDASEAAEELLELLPSLNTSGQLVDVCIDFNVQIIGYVPPSGLWAVSLQSLRRLRLDFSWLGGHMTVDPALQLMTGLEVLELRGSVLEEAEPGPWLPPSLTRLVLVGLGKKLPPQMERLSKLHSIVVHNVWRLDEDAFSQLPQLPALRRLELQGGNIPPCLSQLTALNSLCLDSMPGQHTGAAGVAALRGALKPLTQLTQLVLRGAPHLPAELAGLTRLQRFGWTTSGTNPGQRKPPHHDSLQLPSGPWLAALREVTAPPGMVADSLQVLAGATALEQLSMPSFFSAQVTAQARILRWAADHPALRCLHLGTLGTQCGEASFRAVVDAMQRKPALRFEFGTQSVEDRMWPEPPLFEPWQLR